MATMFGGALIGALLLLNFGLVWALLPAPLMLLVVAVALGFSLRRPQPWHEQR